ncbi:MAG TPA: glycosyl hydrolase family 65 protein [Acidimicrobiales bacterium]|nr:glycosyl hydrolase family 65 protein [Acidimicrobiales bacterium]
MAARARTGLQALADAGAVICELADGDQQDLYREVSALRDAGLTGETVLVVGSCGRRRPTFAHSGRLVVICLGPSPHSPPAGVIHAGTVSTLVDGLSRQTARRRERRVPHVDLDPGWTVALPPDPADRRRAESLGALANGRVGVRASLEEDGSAADPLFLVAGVYDDDDDLLPGPVWTGVGGPDDAAGRRPARFLDLRGGLLVRLPAPGSALRSVRVVSAADPCALAMRCETAGEDRGPPAALRAPPGAVPFSRAVDDDLEVATTGNPSAATVAVAAKDVVTGGPGWSTLERLAAWAAAPAGGSPGAEARQRLAGLEKAGFDRLLAAHLRARAEMWAGAEVCIEGAPADELAVRFAVHHLLGAAGRSGESAVGPRGLTGDAYAGHVFWDADVFVLPAVAAIDPAAARSMLEYRIRRLPAARRAAGAARLDGARFPWESARDGTDVTPAWVRGRHGELVPIATGRNELHVVSDVAWAAGRYAEWTGDREFLTSGPGRDLVIDAARFWASRIRLDPAGRGHIYGVMGPDEYHEAVDDNAFTNVMARWNLRTAAGLLAGPGGGDPEEVQQAAAWVSLADRLVDGWDPGRHTFEQFAGYFGLERLMVEDVAHPPVAMDLILGAKRVSGSQLIKQADVLMLHHMVPDEVPGGSLGPSLDFYGPRTCHGSSLSPAIHASLLARAGRTDEALRLFRLAARLDLDDVTGTTAGGVHLATMGGLWQALAYGFLGLGTRGGALVVDPHLPEEWSAVTMRFRFGGVLTEVRADRTGVAIRGDYTLSVITADGLRRVQAPGGLIESF